MALEPGIERIAPYGKLRGIKFELMTGNEIEKLSSVKITESNDVTSSKLGLPNTFQQCTTCGSSSLSDCDGHFGAIKLPMTIYNPHMLQEIVLILNQICPGCKSIKRNLQKKGAQSTRRRLLMKVIKSKLLLKSKSVPVFSKFVKDATEEKESHTGESSTSCKYCTKNGASWYPKVTFKITTKDAEGKKDLGIAAEISKTLPRKFLGRSLADVLPTDFWDFIPLYPTQKISDLNRKIITPAQAFYLLRELPPDFIKKSVLRRESLFLSAIPVTPNCQRVMEVTHAYGPKLAFDDRTKAYRRLMDLSKKPDNNNIKQYGDLRIQSITTSVLDCINLSKLHSSGRNILDDNPSRSSGMKWFKDVVLSKRSDNAFRMTMIGDAKLKVGEIGLPADICENMFIEEHVNKHNWEMLNSRCNMQLFTKEQVHARVKGRLTSIRKSDQLKIGTTLYRPLVDGDIVLINRPPSVHQHSLLGMKVKILPSKSVVSINPLCCAPLLGDFDGDCLHGFVPQSLTSRVEIKELLTLDHQILNVQDGRSLISLTHDSLTAAHLLTTKEVFFDKYEIQQFEMLCRRGTPFPPRCPFPHKDSQNRDAPLWTGQQLFSMLIPKTTDFSITSRDIDVEIIRDGEIIHLPEDSSWLRNNTTGIFTSLARSYEDLALEYISSAQNVLCEYLTKRGFSVSLADLYLTSDVDTRNKLKDEVRLGLEEAELSCFTNELFLEPKMDHLLKCGDESHDESHSSDICEYPWERNQIHPTSIAAFKNVFRDIQSVAVDYIARGNSMLDMINSGSKGNVLKLVQQGACVGIQLSANALPYNIPRELTCHTWNQMKASPYEVNKGAIDFAGGQNSYAVIKTSLLDGLNPMELLLHSLSNRANCFGEKADVPGTLTRKLMYHMRDLSYAYDGTVRSTYGQQMVQFSYDSLDEGDGMDIENTPLFGGKSSEFVGAGGQPVGSWAACALSEAAYGALDIPVNSLESSPLLNLKKVIECGPSKASLNRTASLYLSENLKRVFYGPEYGALEVKNHLDRVIFSDVVIANMIFYDPDAVKSADVVRGTKLNLSPWISHFHLDQKKMRKNRLTLKSIIATLRENYDSIREAFSPRLPKLHITSSSRSCSEDCKANERNVTACILVAVEDSDSPALLGTVRDSVMTFLLDTLIKGFVHFKQVDIMWDSSDPKLENQELFLRVSMSENCTPAKFWGTLLDACLPIMDLINWEKSHPDGVHDITRAVGIDAAWKYFLKTLKLASADTGRTVREEHLILVANTLSLSGEFHGLSPKGLKQPKNQLSLSSPFTQACFSKPESCFIEAAKQGLTDHLSGTIDAMAWGKEAPVGAGTSFELIYNGKVGLNDYHETKNVYSSLHRMRTDQVPTRSPPRQNYDNMGIDGSTSIVESVGSNSESEIVDMISSLRNILHEYPIDTQLNEADKKTVMTALMYHPRRDAKIGVGIKEIKVGRSPKYQASRCFLLTREDGTVEDFSYRKCVIEAASLVSPEFRHQVERRLRPK